MEQVFNKIYTQNTLNKTNFQSTDTWSDIQLSSSFNIILLSGFILLTKDNSFATKYIYIYIYIYMHF